MAECDRSTDALNLTKSFKESVNLYEKQLRQIKQVKLYLQKEHRTVADCSNALVKLTNKVARTKMETLLKKSAYKGEIKR